MTPVGASVVVVAGMLDTVVVVVVVGEAWPLAMITIKSTTNTATMISERRRLAKKGGRLNDDNADAPVRCFWDVALAGMNSGCWS